MTRTELLAGQLTALGLEVEPQAQERLLQFLDELLRWNRRINLTAITDPEEGIEKHLVDSLTLLPLLQERERLLDLGSGGGFPGIPCLLARPGLQVTTVDAVQKKIHFQRHVARLLGTRGLQPLHCRAEDLPRVLGEDGRFDLVVSRAFTSLGGFLALGLPCLAQGGRLVAMKGAEGRQELDHAQPEIASLGLVCSELRELELPLSRARRTLLVFERA
ncbi:ribosomal RNA small subunit methyltransferase G [Desulfuromonas versatilis]|uniref:Ribosomal RNA small subunit methyltransferase G n=1 Tax=Desulfuromonas versatilis TaxID=2802975 RepID=A0ABM8HQZ2_9BACT|nr:16S rRNA (guanine(527)-N(7))-methyltransferase RsmG [Desulfuromonas versatilis]BCR02947.1 ribosomal RNA small subunit methyltransferase G [Desulfuromonas versatilis]